MRGCFSVPLFRNELAHSHNHIGNLLNRTEKFSESLASYCTFRDYLTVGPDPLTLDSTRLSAQECNRQAVRRGNSMKSLVAGLVRCSA
jgi:hypothetical protein